MAEAVVFSLASKILSAVASPAFNMAKEKGVLIWEARDELTKLQVSVETIHAVLLDAEKKQEGSAGVKNWIKRLKGVLFDAEDLFDEVATENLMKQQMMEGNEKLSLKKKVLVSCSKLNSIVSRNSIAKKVKAIRMSLDDISRDMTKFEFVQCQEEKSMFNMGRGEDRGCFVDAKYVIGRDEDKKTMLKMLNNESENDKYDSHVVLAIVGIGGMGKTTLAQLIYNDEEVGNNFINRWFACISDISDEREVLGKIFQSIRGESYSELDVGQLQIKIRESIKDKKYILILDDVWEEDRTIWRDRLNLLSNQATESRIIVTTRSPIVAKAVGALRPHNLEGLSEEDSWSLFKSIAFSEEYENDPRRESLGKEILKKCSGVPLAIRSIASLLYSKNTMEEWKAIEREDLPLLGRKYNDKTMRVLKLSYDHLPSHLKHCFAFCCLFPKDYEFSKWGLINHWIAQGYIDLNDEESGFLHLLRRGFFQEVEKGDCGEVKSCKMHDLMHDLAIYVAGEESVVTNRTSSYTSSCVRHISYEISYSEESLDIMKLVANAKSLRSLLLTKVGWWHKTESVELDPLFASFKLLRTLSLSQLGIKIIPSSIGELKLMRYLDLSHNDFEKLPNSITYLVNLFSLNLEWCSNFKAWPINFHKLTNLMYLNVRACDDLTSMPIGIGKLTHLRYLSDFKTEKGSKCLNASTRLLRQLRGKLSIEFLGDVDEGLCSWPLPVSLRYLEMRGYEGLRIPGWGNSDSTSNLTRLSLIECTKVKYLPPLRCLPNLRWLEVRKLLELEFMEEGDYNDHNKFFPCLEELVLYLLPKLKRCWGAFVEFPLLCKLTVESCPKLEFKSFPLCPRLQVLDIDNGEQFPTNYCSSTIPPSVAVSRCKWQWSLASLQYLTIDNCSTLHSLHLASPHLQKILIRNCKELRRIEVSVQEIYISQCNKLTSIGLAEALSSLTIASCHELHDLHIARPNALEQLTIWYPISSMASMNRYPISSMEGIDWDSISNIGQCSSIREIDLKGDVGVAFIQRLLSSSASSLTRLRINDYKYNQGFTIDEFEASSFVVWSKGVNWDSIPNLQKLQLHPLPPLEKLPKSLVQRQACGQLQIISYYHR